ncbi:MAG: patatin family protein [Oscillospiraceae bacterium]|jgi:predicted patatin/cPLA2 family phospholipase|nr:patatin family protein [Oscillospiraceae bacterium]
MKELPQKPFGWDSLRSPKTALLAEGGGQLGIYGVGVFQCFYDYGITFPYYIGVSAAAANIASHLAGHRDRTARFYQEYAARPAYMGLGSLLRTGSYCSLEYIYDTLTNHLDPIDYDTLLACKDEIRVVVTDARTGQADYYGNGAFAARKCTVLMASCALPVFCRPVPLDGRHCFDGGVADSLPVEQALREGCERIVAILNRPGGYEKPPEKGAALYGLLLRRYPALVKALRQRHVNYMTSLRRLEALEAQGRAVLIRPEAPLPIRTFTRRPAALLSRVREQGYADAKRALERDPRLT